MITRQTTQMNSRISQSTLYEEAVKNKKVLYLILYKEIFESIVDGVKTMEYRDKTKYWDKRILNREYDYIRFSNGYGNDTRPYMICEYRGYTIDDVNARYELPISDILELGNYWMGGQNVAKSDIMQFVDRFNHC